MSEKTRVVSKLRDIGRFEPALPSDIAAVTLLLLAADVVLLLGVPGSAALAPLVGIPLVLVVPGYLLVALLFPRRSPYGSHDHDPLSTGWGSYSGGLAFGDASISWTERLALSVGTSIAVVPLLGLLAAPLAGSLSQQSVLLALNAYVLVGVVVGTVQRNLIPKEERLRVPYRPWLREAKSFLTQGGTVDTVLSVLLVVSVVAAAGTMWFALLYPADGESYTSATLLSESEGGELVASGYPTELTRGEGEPLTLRVANNEGAETTYSVLVKVQRLDTAAGSTAVAEEETVLRRQRTVSAGGAWQFQHEVTPTMVGEDIRLSYLIYRGDLPADPTRENAYRSLHLWVSVSEPA